VGGDTRAALRELGYTEAEVGELAERAGRI